MKRSLVKWIGLSICAVLAALALRPVFAADTLAQEATSSTST